MSFGVPRKQSPAAPVAAGIRARTFISSQGTHCGRLVRRWMGTGDTAPVLAMFSFVSPELTAPCWDFQWAAAEVRPERLGRKPLS
jgi:hypothetical protein